MIKEVKAGMMTMLEEIENKNKEKLLFNIEILVLQSKNLPEKHNSSSELGEKETQT